jgi:hypothetical protein
MFTRDALLKTGTLLNAEPVGKVIAGGTLYTGNSKPLDDNDCEGIADSFLKAIGTYSASERAKIIAAVTKSGTPGFQASGAGLGVPSGDALRHLDSSRARDMKNISAMNAANKTLAAKLGSGLTR